MPYANQSIWGAPNTWAPAAVFYAVGDGDSSKKTQKPRIAVFDSSSADNRKGSLIRGIGAGKIPNGNAPIDSSICPCKQDSSISCFGKIALFTNKKNAENNKIPDVVVERTDPSEWFLYETVDYDGGFRNHLCNRDNGKEKWSPNFDGSGYSNNNLYIAPLVYWQLKSILVTVEVDIITNYNSGNPTVQTVSLKQWKTNYSTSKICRVRMVFCGVTNYAESTDEVTYSTNRYMDWQHSMGVSLMDEVYGVIDYATFQGDRKQWFELIGTNIGNYYDTASTYYMTGWDRFQNAELKTYTTQSTENGWCLWMEIPYSEYNYEQIMKMVACFGLPFTDTSTTIFNINYLHDDLYLPIIEGDGTTKGRYTHGAANADNFIYHLKSIFGFVPDMYATERPNQISVYDISEPQSGFKHNGLAILMPIECISDKEDAGRWDLTLKHPIDDYKKWTYIQGQNVLKVNGQLFRIDEIEIYQDANESYIDAHAKHISYDLFDRFVDELTGEAETADYYIYKIIERSQEILPTHQPEPNEYLFEVESDINGPFSMDIRDQTVIGALFGDDNSILSRGAGQLYRDNFHISINATMEHAPAAPAFQLRYGTDLTKLSYKIDFSNWVTELICKDNLGDIWGISYTGSEWIMNNQKTRIVHFTYDSGTADPMGCLMKDGFAYWQTVSTPTVSIEVGVAALKNDPKYKDFVDLQNLDVGYTGSVYIEQYNIDVNMKIVSIRRNELTGEAIQVVLGTARGSLVRSPVMSQTIVANGTVLGKQEQIMQEMQNQLEDIKLKQMRTWGGLKSYTWSDAKIYKWGEIFNGHKNN